MHFLPLLIPLPLLAFWLWMFHDMLSNQDLTSSPWTLLGVVHAEGLPRDPRPDWTIAFLLLNVFGAGMYYVAEYRRR